MDKNQAIIDYLYQCPTIANHSLFFNFAESATQTTQIVTSANEKNVQRPFVDGSVMKRYTFTIIDYRSVTYQALVNVEGCDNENVDELFDTQSIINWIEDQNDNRNFPDFGAHCVVESITTTTEAPTLAGLDVSSTQELAKYSVSIQVDYLDTSKCIWN